MVKQINNKIINRVKSDNERGARVAIIEDLFYDFYRSRVKVYWMNFVRGIFFGFGSVLGATVVVAVLIWVLGQSAGIFPSFIGDVIKQIVNAMQK